MDKSNYVEKPNGYFKKRKSVVKGSASYFSKEPPPMRDQMGRPMKNYDEIDIAKWIEEVNAKSNQQTNS